MFWLLYYLAWLPFHIFAPFKVYGKKNIERKKNYVITCNHLTYFDPVILDFVFKSRNRYLAKKELFKKKSNRFWLGKIFGGIAIDREKGLTPTQIREVNNVLKNKQNLGIFPDGTRKNFDSQNEIKGGACFFAIHTRTPIIPCYIVNKHKFFKKNSILVGKPFELSQFYGKKIDKEVLAQADDILKQKILELKDFYETQQKEKKLLKNLKKV